MFSMTVLPQWHQPTAPWWLKSEAISHLKRRQDETSMVSLILFYLNHTDSKTSRRQNRDSHYFKLALLVIFAMKPTFSLSCNGDNVLWGFLWNLFFDLDLILVLLCNETGQNQQYFVTSDGYMVSLISSRYSFNTKTEQQQQQSIPEMII